MDTTFLHSHVPLIQLSIMEKVHGIWSTCKTIAISSSGDIGKLAETNDSHVSDNTDLMSSHWLRFSVFLTTVFRRWFSVAHILALLCFPFEVIQRQSCSVPVFIFIFYFFMTLFLKPPCLQGIRMSTDQLLEKKYQINQIWQRTTCSPAAVPKSK